MDVELARTFLKVVDTGSFVKAAEHLFVTQAAVSRRIRVLEQDLGCRLFVRNKSGATLTPAGRRFARHAEKLVHTLEQARHEVGVSRPYRRYLAVGGRLGLWEGFLLHWLPAMRARAPDVVIRSQIGFENDLTRQLIDGSLDIGVMYTPQHRPGFVVEQLFEDELVLVTTCADGSAPAEDHIQVEWGTEFLNRKRLLQPEFGNPGIIAGVGWLGLQHALVHGGSLYLPQRLARPCLERGQLHLVPASQRFWLPAYMVYPAEHDAALFAAAMDSMRETAAAIRPAWRATDRRSPTP